MYSIDYGTGVKDDNISSLEEAKQTAETSLSYTQQSVRILKNDLPILISRWYGTAPQEDDEVLAQFGEAGFFELWTIAD